MVIQLGNKNSNFGLSRAYLYAYRLGILSAFILFLLGIHLLLPISIDTNVAEGAATPSTTTLAINTDYSSANLDFTTISSTGTFASSSAEDIAKFTVTTNNYTGYTLTLAGNDDTGQLNNITAGAALDSIATSGIESSSFSTNEWGYLPSKYNSEANTTKYYSAPTTSDADTLDVTNAANSTANEYTIGLGAKVDYSKPAGTYTNTFILAAVGNPVNYSVNYLDGTGDSSVQNLPTTQSSATSSTSVELNPNKTPTRTGYTFNKWCLGTVNTTEPSATDHTTGTVCTGTQYESGDSVSFIDQTVSTNALNLYALWTPNTYTITIKTAANIDEVSLNNSTCTSTNGCNVTGLKYNNDYTLTATPASDYKLSTWILSTPTGAGIIADTTSDDTTFTVGLSTNTITPTAEEDITYMQNWTGCTAMSTGDTITLADKRDNEKYLVGKLADGNCWLLDNMRLDLTAVDLNNAAGTGLVGNTNATATTLGYLKNGGGSEPNPASGVVAKTSSGGSWAQSYSLPYIATAYKNTVASVKYGIGSGKIGVYYNYCAASAGSYCYQSSSSDDASQDICPIGWKMPEGSQNKGSYYYLYNTGYNGNGNNFKNALSVMLSGRFYNSAINQGENGYFWSSSQGGGSFTSMNSLSITSSSSISAQNSGSRDIGYSVRCIVKHPVEAMTMQEIGNLSTDSYNNIISSMEEGKAYTVIDIRDDKAYKIAKLKDGNIWLLDNLQLDPTAVSEAALKGNTNATDQAISCLKNGTNGTTGCSSPYTTNAVVAKTSSGGTWSNSYNSPYINTTYNTGTTVNYGSGSGKVGVYYNYCAASAGSYCYTMGNGTGDMRYDLCPSGWKIPNGGQDKGSYGYLYQNGYGGDYTVFQNAISATLAGIYNNDGSPPSDQGNSGFYWSTSRSDGNNMYYLQVNSWNVSSNISNTRDNGVSIRCILKDPALRKIESTSMQDLGKMSSNDKTELLGLMTEGIAYNTSDARDGEEYKIAKLKDGNVWLLDNMRLDLTTVSLATLKGNTNATDQTLTYLKNGGGSSPYPASGVGGFFEDSHILPRIATGYKDTVTTSYGNGSGKIGVYYNYCAASAGSYCYAEGAGSGSSSQDICPSGWKMPTGGSSGQYETLYVAYSSNDSKLLNALSTPLSGVYTGTSGPFGQGTYGRFWGSTFYNANYMHYLDARPTAVAPRNGNSRTYGQSVRCILK